jgi:hypothetical protein
VRPSKSWDEFVVAWAGAFGGYDVRHAGASQRRLLHTVYRLSHPLATFGVRAASMTLLALVCWLAVPLLAMQRGPWPALAALVLAFGLLLETVGNGLIVLTGQQTRLASFYQSLVQRLSEASWLASLMVLGAKAWPVVAVGALVWLHEYVRARGGAAELRPIATNTVGDRPTRIWMTVAALVLAALAAPIGPDLAAGVVTLVVLSWLALALIGFGQLLSLIRKVLA